MKMIQTAEDSLRAAGCPNINLQLRADNKAVVYFCENICYVAENIVNMGKRLEYGNPYRTD